MKKRIVFSVIAVFALLFAACGSAYNSSKPAAAEETYEAAYTPAPAENFRALGGSEYKEAAMDYEADVDYAETPAMAAAQSGNGSSPRAYNGDVKLIYRADVSAETTDLENAAAELEKMVESCGGYIEASDFTNYTNNSYISRSAYYTIRVPAEQYGVFLENLSGSGICTVTNLSKSTTDVGAEYADTEAHLETCRIKQERLQTLLEQAENMEDIITIENALTDVEYEIEYYSSSLNRYDSLIGFSTISVSLQQVTHETAATGEGSLGERIHSSFTNGIAGFAEGFQDFLVDVAGALIPLLIIAAIIAVVVILIVRKVKKGPRKKNTDKRKKNAPEDENSNE